MGSEATRCDGPAEIRVLIPPAVDAPHARAMRSQRWACALTLPKT